MWLTKPHNSLKEKPTLKRLLLNCFGIQLQWIARQRYEETKTLLWHFLWGQNVSQDLYILVMKQESNCSKKLPSKTQVLSTLVIPILMVPQVTMKDKQQNRFLSMSYITRSFVHKPRKVKGLNKNLDKYKVDHQFHPRFCQD